jgi:hypothetical protein
LCPCVVLGKENEKGREGDVDGVREVRKDGRGGERQKIKGYYYLPQPTPFKRKRNGS